MTGSLLILGWHNVAPTSGFPSVRGCGESGLRQQLRLLRRGAHVVDLADALRDLQRGRELPCRAVAITFDDGYRDNVTLAAPLLRDLGLPATFFLVPEFLSGRTSPWWEVLGVAFDLSTHGRLEWQGGAVDLRGHARRAAYESICADLKLLDCAARGAAVADLVDRLAPRPHSDPAELFMDWSGAEALTRLGFSIGSHSLNHAILANESTAAQRSDLSRSRRELQERLDVPVELLAYPNGSADDFDTETETAARDAGYQGAVTTIAGTNSAATPPFRLRRYVVGPERGVRGLAGVGKDRILAGVRRVGARQDSQP